MMHKSSPIGSSHPVSSGAPGGLVAAMVTPCRAVGEPDLTQTTALCRRLCEAGCDGLLVLGSTGESPLVDEQDRARIFAAAREGTPAGKKIFAQVTGLGLKQTIRQAKRAADVGADLAVVTAPYFLKLSQGELRAFLTAVADASPIPVALYHHLRAATAMEVDTVLELAKHPNIRAIKDTSSEGPARIAKLVRGRPKADFAVFQGREQMVLESLQAGADGCVTALACIAPEKHRELIDALARGDLARAQQAQAQITDFWELFRHPLVQESFYHFAFVLRTALRMRGWLTTMEAMVPGSRPPAELEKMVAEKMKAIGMG